MKTIIIKPKSKEEEDLLTLLFKKMKIEAIVVEEHLPAYETHKPAENVSDKKISRNKKLKELSGLSWEELSEVQRKGVSEAIDQLDAGKGIPSAAVFRNYKEKYKHA